ncbi:hypothetical protein [uncultured Abyssibacter sp.]|uniref:hypothetical protein n=1 Tax=uncultured Abyssibacter sp. TaxID=2320202 RepID=UPI0032B14632|tara:strand:+ start:430 stop:915 length:486 start_codon:yes stop_codon:yes gene_type:complete
MAVREQTLRTDVDAHDRKERARERRHASMHGRPEHQERIRRAVHDARRGRLRRASESFVRFGVGLACGLLIARLFVLPLQVGPASLVEWIATLSAPLATPFSGLLPSVDVLGAAVDLSVVLAIAVYWLIGRGIVSGLRLMLGEQSHGSHWNSDSPFGGSRS